MIENEEAEMIILELEEKLAKTIAVLQEDYATIRAGKVNPHILDKIQCEAYGGMSQLRELGNFSVMEGNCLVVSLWDKSLLRAAEKAIKLANLGVNPTNDGKVIRLVFPPLTDERRRELDKQVRRMGEESKVAIRNCRREALDGYKKMKTNKEISEDEHALCEKEVEETVVKAMADLEKVIAAKEKEILTV